MKRNLFLEGEFTTLNPYINAERTNRFMGAKIKKEETNLVKMQCLREPPFENYPVHIKFIWHFPNTRTDPDNIAFAKKFILDGLQEAGVLAGDDWKRISGFEDEFVLDPAHPGVVLEIKGM